MCKENNFSSLNVRSNFISLVNTRSCIFAHSYASYENTIFPVHSENKIERKNDIALKKINYSLYVLLLMALV